MTDDAPVEHEIDEHMDVDQPIQEDMSDDQVTTAQKDDAPIEPEKSVPLQHHIKLRKRAQEAEERAKWYQDQLMAQQRAVSAPPVEDDTRKYESATKADLDHMHIQVQEAAVRIVEERKWIKDNPDKAELVNELLSDFLKQRPNLRHAINSATNRYEEAYTLMNALTPKQQASIKSTPAPKKDAKPAPGSPGGVPKGAALNQAVDVMSMSDKEYSEWKAEKKKAAARR